MLTATFPDGSKATVLAGDMILGGVCTEEEWTRRYLKELQDSMECVAWGREPRAGRDLAFDAIQVHHAAYGAAEDGGRVDLA